MSAVHVVATGARTPLGNTPATSALAVRGRISRVVEHPFIVDLRGEHVRLAMDGSLPPGMFGRERMLELAKRALAQVVRQLDALQVEVPIPILLGLPEPRLGWDERDACWLAGELTKSIPGGGARWSIVPLLDGHAASLLGLRDAVARIGAGTWSVAVVGGVDSYLHPETLVELDGREQLDADDVRSGFLPGEGAGFLALGGARLRDAGFSSTAVVRRVHVARETNLIGTNDLNLGEALADAIRGAASALEPGQSIEDIYCDINGERYRTEEWGFALSRTADLWKDPAGYHTATAEWGDVGAASGALLAVLAVEAWRGAYSSGRFAMIWSSSPSGLRGAAVFERENTSVGADDLDW